MIESNMDFGRSVGDSDAFFCDSSDSDLEKNGYFGTMELVNRELSWLSFNERVLQEAIDKKNPLIERIKFLGIYSNNLDEFFRVRVAAIKRMIVLKKKEVQGFEGGPKQLLEAIKQTVVRQQRLFEIAYQKILLELEREQVFHFDEVSATKEEKKVLSDYFHDKVKHSIIPILLDKRSKFPNLREEGIYLAIKLTNLDKEKVRYALIEIPPHIERFKVLTQEDGAHRVIILDDIVRLHLEDIFAIFKADRIDAFTFKFTRDAELDLEDSFALSLVDKMEKGIKDRKKGNPVRLVYDARMPVDLLDFLVRSLGLRLDENIIPGGKYHNFKDFMRFPDFGKKELLYLPQPPVSHPVLSRSASLFKQILEKDELLHFPYQKFDYVVDLLREASIDPKVEEIYINIYRVAGQSQVMNALISALKNGKKVNVVFELLARFDEENNLYYSNVLGELGARIVLGVPGFKVHSKQMLIKRVSNRKTQFVAYIGTGNFHEGTAKVYEDFGLLTANPKITNEVSKVFRFLENNVDRGLFRELIVSPFNSRRKLVSLIDEEIRKAKKGLPCGIFLKLNNLVDTKMVHKLYDASRAGVPVRILNRGMCALVPGIAKQSEHIQVRSIVGRYLEHSRVLVFGVGENQQVYLSSADWMMRNLDKRVEVATPVLDKELREQITAVLELQWRDNEKSRIIGPMQKNKYVKALEGDVVCNSQRELYAHYAAQAAKTHG
jgi:polyphosphate kinase